MKILNMAVTVGLGQYALSDLFLPPEAEGSKARKSALIHGFVSM